MAASKLRLRISQLVHMISTKFQRLNLCIRGPTINHGKLPCSTVKQKETGSGKFKMAASTLRLSIYQLAHKIATKFQRLNLCVRGPNIKHGKLTCSTVKQEETGSGKFKMAASKLRLRISQIV